MTMPAAFRLLTGLGSGSSPACGQRRGRGGLLQADHLRRGDLRRDGRGGRRLSNRCRARILRVVAIVVPPERADPDDHEQQEDEQPRPDLVEGAATRIDRRRNRRAAGSVLDDHRRRVPNLRRPFVLWRGRSHVPDNAVRLKPDTDRRQGSARPCSARGTHARASRAPNGYGAVGFGCRQHPVACDRPASQPIPLRPRFARSRRP